MRLPFTCLRLTFLCFRIQHSQALVNLQKPHLANKAILPGTLADVNQLRAFAEGLRGRHPGPRGNVPSRRARVPLEWEPRSKREPPRKIPRGRPPVAKPAQLNADR
jgi:hypothetical protein